jgi:hypothetical protein
VNPSFRKYLDEKQGHLSTEERAAIEPVLIKYRTVFYVEVSNEFKGTDFLVVHKAVRFRKLKAGREIST